MAISEMRNSCVSMVSKTIVYPSERSKMEDMKLSVSDLPMLSCHYIQKGCLFTPPPFSTVNLINHLKESLSVALTKFPPLAGRLKTNDDGYVYITCNDAGVDFIHAIDNSVYITDILSPIHVPHFLKHFFAFHPTVSFHGHFLPILAVQVTQLADGVFISCSVNHSVTDGTSFWNFFNTFADLSKGGGVTTRISKSADFTRDSVFISPAVLRLPENGPVVSFNENEPLTERIFSFTRDAILELKAKVNNNKFNISSTVELLGKQSNDSWSGVAKMGNWFRNAVRTENEISSFQSLCALLWRCVTRARKMNPSKSTTFRMAVNCRHRLEPKLNPMYFGNAIQSVPTVASVGQLMNRDLRWAAQQLNKNVKEHDNTRVRKYVDDWENNPRCFPLGNFDGGMITMGSSPRFPMFDNDFGWGRPVAVRSGRANKFDGKISAFPGRDADGTVDLEVVLSPNTMTALESDPEFMYFVSHF